MELLTPQIQLYKILLGLFAFVDFNLKILETMLNYAHKFIKIRLVFHTPYLWNEAEDSQFLFHFWN